MTITDKLEGILPADGKLTTKDERVIAEAVRELRERDLWADFTPQCTHHISPPSVWPRIVAIAALAFSTGCIASAIFVVLV